MAPCPCGFDGGLVARWSMRWHQMHTRHHLATFPDVDERTRRNLDMLAETARWESLKESGHV